MGLSTLLRGLRILPSRDSAGGSVLGPAARAGGWRDLSWLSGHKVSQAACVIKPSIWLCPEGCWGWGWTHFCLGPELGQPEAPGRLGFTSLVARLATAVLLPSPRLEMLQGPERR